MWCLTRPNISVISTMGKMTHMRMSGSSSNSAMIHNTLLLILLIVYGRKRDYSLSHRLYCLTVCVDSHRALQYGRGWLSQEKHSVR